MNYLMVKMVHVTGLGLTFMGLAGVLAAKMAGEGTFKKRRAFHLAHGLGLLLLIGTGIIMVAQMKQWGGMNPLPGWIKAKLGIWLLAGGAMGLAVRFGTSRYASLLLIFFAVLVALAAWLAITKPF